MKVKSSQEDDKEYFETDIVTDFAIDEWKLMWKGGIVTYAAINTSNDPAINNWENRLLAIAIRAWQLAITDLKFKRERKNPTSADIILKFETGETNDTFKKQKGVLAYAYFPGQGKVSGDVTFNDDVIWTKDGKSLSAEEYTAITGKPVENQNNTFRTYNAIHTLIHEIGHGIGLRHNSDCKDCVMYPYYNGTVTLADNDRRRIQGLEDFKGYGERKMSAWWSRYWHNRAIRKFNGVRPKK
jgi:hypothetical protein